MMKEKILRFISAKNIMISHITQPRLAIFMPWNNGKGVRETYQSLIFKDNLYSVLSDASDPDVDNSA